MAKISVIMPIYNSSAYLHKSINSVLSQTYTDFELLLIDDGSTDSSLKICEEFREKDKRIKVFHKQNSGVADTRQTGLDAISGEYFINIDSDDYAESELFGSLLKKAESSDADLVYCDYYSGSKSTNEKLFKQSECDNSIALIRNIFAGNCLGSLWNKLIKTDCVRRFGVVFEKSVNYCEDELFILRLLSNNIKISYLNKALYHYVIREGGIVGSRFSSKDSFGQLWKLIDLENELVESLFIEREFINKRLNIKLQMLSSGLFSFDEYQNKVYCSNLDIRHSNRNKIKKMMLILANCKITYRLAVIFAMFKDRIRDLVLFYGV